MAPLTRSRAPQDQATELAALYYAQRGTAGLIVSEGTPISREGQGYLHNPGIFRPDQVEGWRKVTRSVHAVGGRMFAQIWHVGRVSHTSIQHEAAAPVSATGRVALGAMAFGFGPDGQPGFVQASPPRALTTAEVRRVVEDFAQAAENAILAGFDGVEIHGANGYLHEQFLNPAVNDRDDPYGAARMADRLRFTLEVVEAVSARIGPQRTGIRLSPFGQLFDMPLHEEIEPTYLTLAAELAARNIAYIHLMDQTGFDTGAMRIGEGSDRGPFWAALRRAFAIGAVILAGGMTRAKAERLIGEGVIDLAAFGQPFIANPDLVARLRDGLPLAAADKATFYGGGAEGYVDYPPLYPAAHG